MLVNRNDVNVAKGLLSNSLAVFDMKNGSNKLRERLSQGPSCWFPI